MFAYTIDFQTLSDHLDAAHTIACLNQTLTLFDTIADRFDVFKVGIKADGSYMVVAGIHDQSYLIDEHNGSQTVEINFIKIK